MRVFQSARKFEQLVRVVSRIDATVQDRIVASEFALAPQLCGGKPHEGMNPIHRASQFAADLSKPVVAGDVREFVGEDGPSPICGPVCWSRGKQDAGLEKTLG